MFYTYLWLRDCGTPYYVGKGKGNRGFTSVGHRVYCPKDPVRIILQDWPSEEDAFAAEKFLIVYYGRADLGTGCLRNLTDGGEGISGLIVTEENRRKKSLSLKGNTNCVGRILSEDTRRKMRESSVGRPKSTEHRKHLSESRTGQSAPAVIESNIRRRSANPSKAALRQRAYRVRRKEKLCQIQKPALLIR